MTVAALPATISYIEDGVSTVFAAPFRFKAASDLIVDRILDAGGVVTLALGVDYTVTGGATDAGGSVTRAAASSGATLRIRRRTARSQPMVYTTGDRFPAKSHEEALDRGTLIVQELDADIADTTERAILLPVGETAAVLPPANLRRGGVLVGDPVTGVIVLKDEALFAPGAAGPAGPTFLTLALFKAAPITNRRQALIAPGIAPGEFFFQTDRAPYVPDEVNVILANGVSESIGAWVRQLAETAYIRNFGADPTGATSSVAAFNAALVAGKRVIGAPGDVYLLDASVVVPAGREIIGNGATFKIASGLEGGLRLANNGCKVSGWTIQGSGGGYAVWAKSLDGTPIEFVDFTDNVCTGNIGHYLLCTNARHVLVTGNRVDGLTANTEITTAIVAEGSRHITVTNNKFRNVTVGWSVQIRGGSSDFTVSNNTFEQTQYSDTKTATAGQTVFTFTFAQSCFLRKVQIGGKPLSTGYTVSGAGPVYTVTFAAGRTAGEVIKLVGYRGAENIQINDASQGVISGNSIDGTADSGIIALGSYLTISANKIRNCGYAGIAIYGDIDNIAATGNVITDCAQMDDGLSSPDNPGLASVFAGAILVSGEGATITGNTIINNSPYTLRYGVMVNKANMGLRTDGTATIVMSGNQYRGTFADGKISAPNQTTGARVNSIAVDGPQFEYPERINLDPAWVETPPASGKFQPADTAYFTVGGSASTRAIRDTAIKQGGSASLQTVAGQYMDFNLTASAMFRNCNVTVSFWAKNAGGSSIVRMFTSLEGLPNSLNVTITDTGWKQYSVSFPLTQNLADTILVRCEGISGSANFQHFSINARRL